MSLQIDGKRLNHEIKNLQKNKESTELLYNKTKVYFIWNTDNQLLLTK